jgi:PKD repeat protein
MVHVTAAEEPLPVATFTITPNQTVDVNQIVVFDAKTDKDPEGKKYTYDWNFGDNISDKGFRTSHTYKTSGSFNVKLTVIDNKGQQTEAVRTVIVLPEVEKMRTVPAQAALYPKENLEIKIAGGIAAYTISTERGRLTQTTGETTTYIAPNITGPDLIIATDQNGKVAKVIIEILREIQVTPIRPLIYPGVKQRFNVIGGKGPYTWSTTVGEIEIVDNIEQSEINVVVPDASIVPRISVTDVNNKSFNVFPRISTKIRISPQTIALKPNKLHNFTAINGVGRITWHTNGGDLSRFEGNSSNYLAPHVAGTYKVLATDAKGDSAEAMIYVNLLPVITPAMSILQTGEETTFRVLRGTAPYTWTVSGAGKIISTNQNGDLATFRAPTTAGRATIIATDSEGKIVQAMVSIQLPNSFAISPTEIHLEPEKTTTLQARGAATVKWSSQLGQLSSLEGKRVNYIAPKNNGVDIITATNDKGESSNAIIFIGGRVTGNGNFYAHVDGSVENPNIIGVWNINNPEDKPQTKTLYVAVNMEEKGLHIVTPTEWQAFNGVDIPIYQQNIKANATKFNIMKNRDVTSLPAFQILLGYGVGENPVQNMLENNKFGVIYP